MKKEIILLLLEVLFIALPIVLRAESDSVSLNPTRLTQPPQVTNLARYKLYPTENMWNFIKLDTRTGKMWIVQYGLEEDKRFEWVLSDKNLAGHYSGMGLDALVRRTSAAADGELYLMIEEKGGEVNGRFALYSTQNMWNFILLDQITGQAYQVQWSLNPDETAVISIPEGKPADSNADDGGGDDYDDVYGW